MRRLAASFPVRVYLIAGAGFFLGIRGIGYGLPLHLVGDEESIVGGALRMLELRTLIPSLHPAAFDLLYYPVGIPYLIILFSLPTILWHTVALHFSFAEIRDFFALNNDSIWQSARLLSVTASVAVLGYVYAIAKELYSQRAAQWSALVLALSFFHVNLGHWAKHWTLATLVVYITFYYTLRSLKNQNARHWLPGLLAGIGIGLSYVSAFGHLVTGIYVIVHRKLLSSRFMRFVLVNVCTYLILASFFIALNYRDFINQAVTGNSTVGDPKTLMGVLQTVLYGFAVLERQETALLLLAAIGLVFVPRYRRENIFIFGTAALFFSLTYIFYHIGPRYVYFIVPALALAAGSGAAWLFDHRRYRVVTRSLLIMICLYAGAVVLQYDRLLSVSDTRLLARNWMEEQGKNSEMILSSPSILAPRTIASLEREQGYASIRAAERYVLSHPELARPRPVRVSYTNLHFWPSATSTTALLDYVDAYRPRYFIIEYSRSDQLDGTARSLMAGSTLITRFQQSSRGTAYDVNGNFLASTVALFSLERLGPIVDVYELQYAR